MLDGRRGETEDRLAVIAEDMAVLSGARGDSTADDEHDPEGVTLSEEWSRLAGMRADLEGEVLQIDAALGRLAAGEYGVCTTCGIEIPVERLEVRPFTPSCVNCAA